MIERTCAVSSCALLVAALACSSTEKPARPGPCEALCARTEECKPWLDDRDVDECIRVCNEENAFDRLTDDAEMLLSTCLGDRSCRSIRAKDAVAGCLDDVLARPGAPSAAARRWCDEIVPATTACGSTMTHEACVRAATIYEEATLEDARRCLDGACAALMACLAGSRCAPLLGRDVVHLRRRDTVTL